MPRNSIPKAIKSIHDPTLRQRATEAWHASNELSSLIRQIVSIDTFATGEKRTSPEWYFSDDHYQMLVLVNKAVTWSDTLADLIGGDAAAVEGLLRRLSADETELRS